MGIDAVDSVAEAAVFRTKIVAPFRDAVSLVDGKERNRELLKEFNGVVLGEGFGCDVKEFGATSEKIILDFFGLEPGKGRIEEVGDAVLARSVADGVNLVLH